VQFVVSTVQIVKFLNPFQIRVKGQVYLSGPQELFSKQLGWVWLNLLNQNVNQLLKRGRVRESLRLVLGDCDSDQVLKELKTIDFIRVLVFQLVASLVNVCPRCYELRVHYPG